MRVVDAATHVFDTLCDPCPRPRSARKFVTTASLASSDQFDWKAMLRPPERADELGRLAHFAIRGEIGRGGMGAVLHAFDTQLQRPTAIKFMLPRYAENREACEQFMAEARAAAKIQHPHVVTIYQVGKQHGVPYIAMELLKGMSLETYLESVGSLSVPQVLRVARQMAQGLQAAHGAGLIHRDIKPANIWLEAPKGHVKILDFGLAFDRLHGSSVGENQTVAGTPLFMSPEQALGEPLDERSDLFSFGVVLYRLCAFQQPYFGNTVHEIFHSLLTSRPCPARLLNPKIPPSLERLIQALLARDPDRRVQSAAEVVSVLSEIRNEITLKPPAASELILPAHRPAQEAPSDRPLPHEVAEVVLSRIYRECMTSQPTIELGRSLPGPKHYQRWAWAIGLALMSLAVWLGFR